MFLNEIDKEIGNVTIVVHVYDIEPFFALQNIYI